MVHRIHRPGPGLGRLTLLTIATVLALATATSNAPAWADSSTATPITGLPYSTSIDFSTVPADAEVPDCTGGAPTAWYTYTAPTDQTLVVRTDASLVAVFTGTPGSFNAIACSFYHVGRFDVAAGQTIYIAVAEYEAVTDTFTLDLAPPDFNVELTLNGRATRGPDPETAIVSGTVTCNNDGYISVSGTLRQKQGLNVARGDFYTETSCSSTPTSWTATVDAGSRIFLTKNATLTATASGCDGFTCDDATASRTVKVVRR